jgi:hypothetical protein
MKLTGKNRRTRGKTCPNGTLSTTNPTWTDPGWNPGLRGERPATNRLSHGTAFFLKLTKSILQNIPCATFAIYGTKFIVFDAMYNRICNSKCLKI